MSNSNPTTDPDFVTLFCQITEKFESPLSFWKWSAFGALAATLRFNCYLNWGTSKLYPNLYILLLADSAVSRKDAGPELVEELLRECAHTKVISGRASWQGIVDELSQDVPMKKGGSVVKGGAGIIIATEFTAMFVEDANLTKLMTEGYAFIPEYQYTLRGGKVTIKNRCISMLGGSNATLLRDLFTEREAYGGLLRRTCLIRPDKRRDANPLVETTDHLDKGDKQKLLDKLKRIQNLAGEFILTHDAKEAYKSWYIDLYNSYDKIDDKSGFIAGAHMLIMKIAMILTAAKESLQITEEIISLAIKEILELKDTYKQYLMGTGKNPHAQMSAVLMADIWSCNGNKLKRRDVLLKYWNNISSEDLDKLIVTLEQAGLIKIVAVGNEPGYELTDKSKEIFLKNAKSQSQGIN